MNGLWLRLNWLFIFTISLLWEYAQKSEVSNSTFIKATLSIGVLHFYQVGDQILEVNGQSFVEVTHDEAVGQLKYHKRMSLLVKDVGKVPHACTAYGGGEQQRDTQNVAK